MVLLLTAAFAATLLWMTSSPGRSPGIDWSDHWSFAQIGAPALMVPDTAPNRYRHYHEKTDTPDKVDYPRLARVVSGLERVIRRKVGNRAEPAAARTN